MFNNFANIIYSGTATESDNTDYSLSGLSKKVTFADLDDTFILDFDAVDISSYEDITLQLSFHPHINTAGTSFLTIAVGSDTYTITKFNSGWNHILIDPAAYNNLSQITFTGKNAGMVMFMDLLGYRKADNSTLDFDIIDSLKNKISLDYDVSTTLAAAITAGTNSISLTDATYIFPNTQLTITDGVNTETVKMLDSSTIVGTFTNSFIAGDTVTANCPVVGEDEIGEDYDPICGLVITAKEAKSLPFVDKSLTGSKVREYTSDLGITLYIETTAKSKVLQLTNEFNFSYGKKFLIILDGEIVQVESSSSAFSDSELGSLPRQAYFYTISPQAVTKSQRIDITDFQIEMESKEWS